VLRCHRRVLRCHLRFGPGGQLRPSSVLVALPWANPQRPHHSLSAAPASLTRTWMLRAPVGDESQIPGQSIMIMKEPYTCTHTHTHTHKRSICVCHYSVPTIQGTVSCVMACQQILQVMLLETNIKCCRHTQPARAPAWWRRRPAHRHFVRQSTAFLSEPAGSIRLAITLMHVLLQCRGLPRHIAENTRQQGVLSETRRIPHAYHQNIASANTR
jgi:hypothetical protein